MRIAAVAFTLGLATTFAAAPAHADHPDGAQLLDEAFAEAFVDDDLDALASLYAPDAVLYNIGGPPAVGPDAIRAALAGFLGAFDVVEFQHLAPRYETSGNLSVGYAEFAITVAPRAGGPTFVIAGRSTTVARRVDGVWSYVHDHASLPQ